MAFIREPINIKRSVKWFSSIVVTEKQQLLMLHS